jgi:hypothetical protein
MQGRREIGMALFSTSNLLVGASLLDGLVAGVTADRGIVGYAAWRELGVQAWVAYSQHADLSSRGLAIYPLLAIGGALFSIATAVRFSFSMTGLSPRCCPKDHSSQQRRAVMN